MSSRAKPTASTAGASTRTSGIGPWPPLQPRAAPAARPASNCTRNRVDRAGPSVLRETGSTQAGVERLLGEGHEWRIGVPRTFCPPLCQRTDLRFQLSRLRQCRPRRLEIAIECKRSRKPKMYKEQSRICRACLAKERYRIVQAAGDEVRRTERPIVAGCIGIVWVEADRLLDERDCRVRLAQPHQRQAKLLKGSGVIAVEG